MPAECVSTLSNGRKCRCMATRGHAFCRHHGAPVRPRRPALDDRLWNRLSCWRHLPADIQEMPQEEISGAILNLLQSLLDNVVSDRFAGRSIRAILQRLGSVPLTFAPEFAPPNTDLSSPVPSSMAPLADPGAEPAPSVDEMLQECLDLMDAPTRASNLALIRSQRPDFHCQPSDSPLPALHSPLSALQSRPSAVHSRPPAPSAPSLAAIR